MAFADFIRAILRLFGIGNSENKEKVKDFSKLVRKAEEQIRKEHNRLNDHKYDIRNIESSVEQRMNEWRKETSQNLRRILGRQLECMFKKLDNWRDIENIIFRNIACWELIEEKSRTLVSAYESEVIDTDILDKLIEEMTNIRGEQVILERAEKQLREQKIEASNEGTDDEVEKLLASFRPAAEPSPASVVESSVVEPSVVKPSVELNRLNDEMLEE